MKRIIFILISGIYIFAGLSCKNVSVKYTPIGKEYSPLPANARVKILLASLPGHKYDEIGIVRIEGGDEQSRVLKAKIIAREKGGTGIVPISTEKRTKNFSIGLGGNAGDLSQSSERERERRTFEVQDFKIVRVPGEDLQTVPGKSKKKEHSPMPDGYDLSIKKRASYKQLLEDYESIRGDRFRGKLFPRKVFKKMPSAIRRYASSDDKLVLLKSKSGKLKLLLLLPGDKQKMIKEMIKRRESLNFVYSPVSVYKSKKSRYPVLKFITEVQ